MLETIKAIEDEARRLYKSSPSLALKHETLIRLRDDLHTLYPAAKKRDRKNQSSKLMDAFEQASQVVFVPSSFYPSRKQLDYIKLVVGDRLLLDIGSDFQKSGATAAALHHVAGLSVKCYAPVRIKKDDYFEVQQLHGLDAIEAHKLQSCVLALFGQAPGDPMLQKIAEKYWEYGGDVILLGGRTCDDKFREFLAERFILAHSVSALTVFPYMPRSSWAICNSLSIYWRKTTTTTN